MNMDRRAFFNRSLLGSSALGFGGLALAAMPSATRARVAGRLSAPRWPTAFCAAGQERHMAVHERRRHHMESFDPKPMLTKYAGKTIAETPFADAQDPKKLAIERLVVPDGNGNQRNTLYPLQVGFRKHGTAVSK